MRLLMASVAGHEAVSFRYFLAFSENLGIVPVEFATTRMDGEIYGDS